MSFIAVPSKSRLNSSTIREMVAEGLRVHVWVDLDEFEDYVYAYSGEPGAIIHPTVAGDIGLIRAEMLAEARMREEQFCWQIDDDVKKVMLYVPGAAKHQKVTWTAALDGMEREAEHWPTCALMGPVPIQYAWTDPYHPTLNGHHNGIVLIRTAAPIDYRYGVIEDMDIVCQAWAAGWHTVRWPEFAYDCPKMGTGPGGVSQGGMREAYDDGWQQPRRQATLEKWEPTGQIVQGGKYGFHLNRKAQTAPERLP